MEKPLETRTPLSQLGLFMFIWMAVMVAFSLVQPLLLSLVLGKQAAGSEVLSDTAIISSHLWLFRALQAAYTMAVFVIPPIIFTSMQKERPLEFLGLNRPPNIILLFISALTIGFSLVFIFYTYQQNQQISFGGDINELIDQSEEMASKFTSALMVMRSPWEFVANLILFAILPALGEEVFFRGGVQRLFARASGSGHLSILFTAIFFSAVHFEFHGFIPRLILAIMFGYMYYWSRNLWLPIFAHMIYNGFQICMIYFIGELRTDKLIAEARPFAAVVVSVVLLFLSMSWLYRRTMGKWERTLEKVDE